MNENLSGKVVCVTGGKSPFLGKNIREVLSRKNCVVFDCPHSICDLTRLDHTLRYFTLSRPDYVIHCAGFNGGIIYNRNFPADIFYKNTLMALNVLEASHQLNVKKILSIMTSCAYPDGLDVLNENDLWKGKPHTSIECHGLAKRNLDAFSRFCNKQYGLNAITAVLTNLYGPGDTFSERGKVVSMLIRKIVTAKQESLSNVNVLGTGVARREFMYVEDAADAVVRALEIYGDTELPINIGTGSDISIRDLVGKIVNIVGYEGQIIWDATAGDGQIKKLLDVDKMKNILKYDPPTNFDEGLRKTVEWYRENKEYADKRK
jgi:GDP-L-fucose synthase